MHENWQNAKFLLESGNCETKLYFCLHIYKVEQKKKWILQYNIWNI